MLPAHVPILDRQMLFVTGKGGVGKTTVATALGLAGARSGRRTIICELGGQTRVPQLLGVEPGAPGVELQVTENLATMSIDSWQVMEEWVSRILGSKALTGLLVRSNFFSAFAEAAPGGLELGEIVKTWELVEGHRWHKRRGYDLVVVDGPASGHAIGVLRTPGTFADIARVGPIASQSRKVRSWLSDPKRTGYVSVALPGELPVSETLDLGARLEASIGRQVEAVFLNGMLPDRFSEAELTEIEAAASPQSEAPAFARAAAARAELQAEQAARLEAGSAAPVHRLPFVFTPHLERDDLEALASVLPLA